MGQRDARLGTLAIVGGGAAGFAAAKQFASSAGAARYRFFRRKAEQPYDRTLLTKDYLEGAFGDDQLPIARHSLADLGVDFEGGASVQQIDPRNNQLRLANGEVRT